MKNLVPLWSRGGVTRQPDVFFCPGLCTSGQSSAHPNRLSLGSTFFVSTPGGSDHAIAPVGLGFCRCSALRTLLSRAVLVLDSRSMPTQRAVIFFLELFHSVLPHSFSSHAGKKKKREKKGSKGEKERFGDDTYLLFLLL